jgi:hypothetical protein
LGVLPPLAGARQVVQDCAILSVKSEWMAGNPVRIGTGSMQHLEDVTTIPAEDKTILREDFPE